MVKKHIKKYNELSVDQAIAKKIIDISDISIISGKAGTGKTRLATIYALEKLALERKRGVSKIVITRPTVGRKEDAIGFLPGDISEKLEPWLKPIYEILYDVEGVDIAERKIKEKQIEILPLMYVQGVTFCNSIVICDEAQNLSRQSAEMLFTRLGKGSKMIFCGDTRQSLLYEKDTGLSRLIEIKDQIEGLGYYELTTNFRHKIIEQLLSIY